jgi:hypothetical protein
VRRTRPMSPDRCRRPLGDLIDRVSSGACEASPLPCVTTPFENVRWKCPVEMSAPARVRACPSGHCRHWMRPLKDLGVAAPLRLAGSLRAEIAVQEASDPAVRVPLGLRRTGIRVLAGRCAYTWDGMWSMECGLWNVVTLDLTSPP